MQTVADNVAAKRIPAVATAFASLLSRAAHGAGGDCADDDLVFGNALGNQVGFDPRHIARKALVGFPQFGAAGGYSRTPDDQVRLDAPARRAGDDNGLVATLDVDECPGADGSGNHQSECQHGGGMQQGRFCIFIHLEMSSSILVQEIC